MNQKSLVANTTVEISPLMKAILVPHNNGAFTIEPLRASAEQPLDPADVTHRQWKVTANQSGAQGLIMVLYRLVKFDGQDYWREVGTYESNIAVQASTTQRLAVIDWKSFLTFIFTSLIVPAFWRRVDARNKKRKPAK